MITVTSPPIIKTCFVSNQRRGRFIPQWRLSSCVSVSCFSLQAMIPQVDVDTGTGSAGVAPDACWADGAVASKSMPFPPLYATSLFCVKSCNASAEFKAGRKIQSLVDRDATFFFPPFFLKFLFCCFCCCCFSFTITVPVATWSFMSRLTFEAAGEASRCLKNTLPRMPMNCACVSVMFLSVSCMCVCLVCGAVFTPLRVVYRGHPNLSSHCSVSSTPSAQNGYRHCCDLSTLHMWLALYDQLLYCLVCRCPNLLFCKAKAV